MIIVLFTVITSRLAGLRANEIKVSPGKYKDYYHLRYDLTPENCELSVPLTERQPRYATRNDYTFEDGGQFEVFIRRDQFPVKSPDGKWEFLILRMPWTNPDLGVAEHSISRKRSLYDAILKMKKEGEGSVSVVVELNPFVQISRKEPLSLELTGRNVFFRQALGQYINYLGPLQKGSAKEAK